MVISMTIENVEDKATTKRIAIIFKGLVDRLAAIIAMLLLCAFLSFDKNS